MRKKVHLAFLILVFVQAGHSIEEYIGRLWEVLAPARFLCSLVSDDLEAGFIVLNLGFFFIGIEAWYFLVRTGHEWAKFVIWPWVVIELLNGIAHTVWAFSESSYVPGLLTAPILFGVAWYLSQLMLRPNDDDKAHSSGS